MSYPQKITLENTIFARAELLRVAVCGKAGRLISSSTDAYLQALLYVYNAFFYEENWNDYCTQENDLEGFYNFRQMSVRTPVFLGKEYKFELIMGEKNA